MRLALISLAVVLIFSSCTWLKPPRTRKVMRYTVQRGDTLSDISRRSGIQVSVIQDENGISDPRALRVGQVLSIPYRAGSVSSTANRSSSQVVKSSGKPPAIGGGSWKTKPDGSRASLRRVNLGRARSYVDQLQFPVRGGKISSKFGWRWLSFHEGIDIAAPMGTPIYAAHSGTVVYSGTKLRGYGNLIVIRGEGLITIYAHNKRNRVRAGERVRRGEHIADLGMSGKATGPHLHFETRVKDDKGKNSAVDPMLFLP